MKIKSALSMGLVLTGLIIGGFTYTNTLKAEASSWHKESPKIARGTWTDKYKYPKGAMYESFNFTNKHLYMSDDAWTNLSYKKIGFRTYKFRGYNFNLQKRVTISGSVHFISKMKLHSSLMGVKGTLYKEK